MCLPVVAPINRPTWFSLVIVCFAFAQVNCIFVRMALTVGLYCAMQFFSIERVDCQNDPLCAMTFTARKREIDVYDRRLEAISAAAELGSFSRAAAKLRVSTPALVKQVSGFEAEFGITLFERSHSGG